MALSTADWLDKQAQSKNHIDKLLKEKNKK